MSQATQLFSKCAIRSLLIGSFLFTAFAVNAQQEVGVAIKPTVFNFNADRGQTVVQNVSVINSQAVPVQLKFYLGDWQRDSLGDHQYFEAGKLKNSCANWVKLSRTFMEVAPNSTASFDMTITIPDSADAVAAMRWAMLFVEYVQETTAPKATGNQVATNMVRKQRIGLHIYETPPAVSGRDFKMLAFQTIEKPKNTYRMTCQNTGNLQLHCKPYLELTALSEEGKTIHIDAKEFPMFPGQKRIIDITVPETTPKGKYNVIAAIDAGEDIPLEAAQAEIQIN